MTNELQRWSDDRLDDLAAGVKHLGHQVSALNELKADLVGVKASIRNMEEDTHSCIQKVDHLSETLDKRAVEQHKERKADRRWMIATFLTTAGLVIAALAIFLG